MSDNKLTIKEKIEKEFGSINRFVDMHYAKMGISRTYLYELLNNQECNPTICTLIRLSNITNIPVEELFDEYHMRYRNRWSCDQHTD